MHTYKQIQQLLISCNRLQPIARNNVWCVITGPTRILETSVPISVIPRHCYDNIQY